MSTAPQTYQQWLECFEVLEKHPWNKEMLALVRQGGYEGPASETIKVRISETVGNMLSVCTQRFLRELDQALEDSEPDMAVLLAIRLRSRAEQCLFYRQLAFLPADYVKKLDAGFAKQLQQFWERFLAHMRRSARESMDPRFEEMAQELCRIKIIRPAGAEAGL